ncbi:MAG: transglutaminase family protein [Alphaproteobacteria bacterium]
MELRFNSPAMQILTVHHVTSYHYDRPVRFGEHALMMRPRDSHDLRMLEASLSVSPAATTRWTHDVFGNSVARVEFLEEADHLHVESTIRIEHYGLAEPDFSTLEPYARSLPFPYNSNEVADLGRCMERHYTDPQHRITEWARQFMNGSVVDTGETLIAMNGAVRDTFFYETREAHGTQTPTETLDRGTGSCRDFALFFMEAVRSLGLGARFVSGYLYDPAMDAALKDPTLPQGADLRGAGATHAWVQVYLPGAGWVEFDPTNGIAGGANLIRVAVARDPAQASPVTGSYYGPPEAFRSLEIFVEVNGELTPGILTGT